MSARLAWRFGLVLALLAGGFALVAQRSHHRRGWWPVVALAFVGGAAGVGLGLPLGAALDREDPAPGPLVLGRGDRPREQGLSKLDALVACAGTAAFVAAALPAALWIGGPTRLLRLAGELSPLAALSPGAAVVTIAGTLAVGALIPQLALAARRPPRERLTRAERLLVGGAGYLAGIVGPPLALAILFK